jgi:integrase
MASLQARHRRACALGKPWTPFAAEKLAGCDCRPTYYVVVRDGDKLLRDRVGPNRKAAARALTKVQASEDDGSFVPIANIAFGAWADRWLAGLERKPNTVASYGQTMKYATEAFGSTPVRRLSVEHVKRFLAVCAAARRNPKRDVGMTDSTRAKHLRVLGVCLESAVKAGYASRNPVRHVPAGERPTKRKQEAAYFTNDELPRLFSELRERGRTYQILFEIALKTGMRQGELLALTWGDVDLVHSVVHVRRTFTDGDVGTPKNHEKREVFVPAEVVDLLGEWWGELGRPGDETTLVLPGETKTGYMNSQVVLRRELYPAMERAGIARVGPTGEKRTFHSLRHTFARLAIENGRPIFWLSKHLGHSSLDVTANVYGHFERATRQREAQAMAGVFGV